MDNINVKIILDFLSKVDIDYEEYGEYMIGDISYNAIKQLVTDYLSLKKENEKLIKENSDLKNRLSWRIGYCQNLEKDLFENCENYVINKETIKNKIKEYTKLSDEFYDKFCKLSPLDLEYRDIRDAGMCCDAKINVLQELLEGRK
mgnify:CR=1 FL=1